MLNLIFDLDSTLIQSHYMDGNITFINDIKGAEFFHIIYSIKKQGRKSKKKRKGKTKKYKPTMKETKKFIVFQRA